jgi:hypothetical protein
VIAYLLKRCPFAGPADLLEQPERQRIGQVCLGPAMLFLLGQVLLDGFIQGLFAYRWVTIWSRLRSRCITLNRYLRNRLAQRSAR